MPHDVIDSLDLATCNRLADYFEHSAAQLRERSAKLSAGERQTARTSDHLASIKDAGKIAFHYAQNGASEEEAVRVTAAMTGHPLETIQAALNRVKKNLKIIREQARNREILMLRNRNWDNKDIATRFGLSVSQVGRIIKKELEA